MNGHDIRVKITENNKRISDIINPAIFTLNAEIAALLEENAELRKKCEHEFDELGFCIYCDQEAE